MTAPTKLTAHGDGVYELAMDDAPNGNTLTVALCEALEDGLTEVAARRDARVVILSGRPDIFCAGAPAEILDALAAGAPGLHVRDLALPDRLLSLPLPLIAAMRGHAVGGGLALALCCDMRIAAATSRYGVNFTDLGFTPGMGTTALLPALIGTAYANEMLMTGKLYKGRELAGLGLFNAVTTASDVAGEALMLARRVAEKPRHVLELLKETLAAPRRLALQTAMAREHLMHQICFSHSDTREAVRRHYLKPPARKEEL